MPIRKITSPKRPTPLRSLRLRLYLRKLLREEPALTQALKLHRPVQSLLRLRLHRHLTRQHLHRTQRLQWRQFLRLRRIQ